MPWWYICFFFFFWSCLKSLYGILENLENVSPWGWFCSTEKDDRIRQSQPQRVTHHCGFFLANPPIAGFHLRIYQISLSSPGEVFQGFFQPKSRGCSFNSWAPQYAYMHACLGFCGAELYGRLNAGDFCGSHVQCHLCLFPHLLSPHSCPWDRLWTMCHVVPICSCLITRDAEHLSMYLLTCVFLCLIGPCPFSVGLSIPCVLVFLPFSLLLTINSSSSARVYPFSQRAFIWKYFETVYFLFICLWVCATHIRAYLFIFGSVSLLAPHFLTNPFFLFYLFAKYKL